jgi:D-alanine-D-alanine ligase-like ATP-grasp enzyme
MHEEHNEEVRRAEASINVLRSLKVCASGCSTRCYSLRVARRRSTLKSRMSQRTTVMNQTMCERRSSKLPTRYIYKSGLQRVSSNYREKATSLIKWISGTDARRKKNRHLRVEEAIKPSKARKICLGHIDGNCFLEALVSKSLPEDMLSRRTRTATEHGNARAKNAAGIS